MLQSRILKELHNKNEAISCLKALFTIVACIRILYCEFVHVAYNFLIGGSPFYNACKYTASLLCEFVHVACNVLIS